MDACCHLSRRQLLKWSALVAATPVVGSLAHAERAIAGSIAAINLELVTITDTSAILTWFTGDPSRVDNVGRLAPVPTDTEVLLDGRTVLHDDGLTPYHWAELTGLEPGRTYTVVCRSNGVVAAPAASTMGSPIGHSNLRTAPQPPLAFTTAQPTPGAHLFTIALCNDLHIGEAVAGLATTQQGIELPPGIRQEDGKEPYPIVMSRALVAETRARGAEALLVAGDLTAEASPDDVATSKSMLDGFGVQGVDWFAARGNHDRKHGDAADAFKDLYFGTTDTWFVAEHKGLRIIGLDTYDKTGNGGDNGAMSAAQYDFLRTTLTDDPDTPTIVFGHHPVGAEASLTTTEPVIFDLDPQQSTDLESLYAKCPGVLLHHAGHTHRNKRTMSAIAPNVVFQEVAATKEYPGGYTLLRVHEGGFATSFVKLQALDAREWSERSRPEYGGLAPFYTYGNTADRNSVVVRDTGLRASST